MITEITVQNPGATKPLNIDLDIVCNTPEEKILSNVLINSRKCKKWAKIQPEHSEKAIICGSGPSLADNLQKIEEFQDNGGKVFALNGAANYLFKNGIYPDCQIIMDAQPETIDLVGEAKEYLFASQVDPSLFDKVDATLWHSTYGEKAVDEQEGFPSHDDDYCLIGAAATVGNTSLVLLYSLGYREFHIFGMDSSHRGNKGHAFPQPMNDGDPCTIVTFNNKRYTCSFTMRLQIDTFINRARQLQDQGCKINVYGDGLLPEIWNMPEMEEEEKYKAMWNFREYAANSPGERVAALFCTKFDPKGTIIDFGAGSGKGSAKIASLRGRECKVIMADFADNCTDEDNHLPFVHFDLTKGSDIRGDYGFCTDVMEHIPPEDVDKAIKNIMSCVPKCFFQICLLHEHFGALIGQTLHLSVYPADWWENKFIELGFKVEWIESDDVNVRLFVTT